MDVAPTMVLLGFTQIASNGMRMVLWRKHVQWRLMLSFTLGALVAFAFMRMLAFLPSKGLVYIMIGGLPFCIEILPQRWIPVITRKGAPFLCGAIITALQMVGGTAGNVLAAFFQTSPLGRREIVATKAMMQLLGHGLRVVYFGSLTGLGVLQSSWWVVVATMGMAMLGTTLGGMVLSRMSDSGFRNWSQWAIRAISLLYLFRGFYLLATG
ncbi:MAG: hypothetical protein KGQ46_02680 [Hyphomicrobiales bacterium]|nr:hypothetical protein [Hyphomicrobiales bacterium]MDE2113692.1 hypothetical protein [Hyphomicrobiales bacterium]